MRVLLVLMLALGCGHASTAPLGRRAQPNPPPSRSGGDAARQISEETHSLLRAEAELLWTRWTTGEGPLPASALAAHPRLTQGDLIETVSAAAARSSGDDARAFSLLAQQLATLAISREAGKEIEALERARAQLAFAAPGEARATLGERDLDHLLRDEPGAGKRAAIALSEAKAAQPLAPLAIARDAAIDESIVALGLGSWTAVEERAHGMPVAELERLADATLVATEQVGARAVASAAVSNLGIPGDRVRRGDLPRLARTSFADPQFTAGKAWPNVRDALAQAGVAPPASLRLDAEPSPSKGARPFALLVDPPDDVRLSLRPTGGFEEQRATLHEGARASGGALTSVSRWELAQLGDGSAAEAVALLFEALAGTPEWLRGATELRGEPLDDLVHTEATRRMLSARRAAAMVLFEIRRRQGPRTAEAQATLYRGLVQRALFCVLSDEDAGRWALEADAFARTASPLLGSILAAQLERTFGPAWWKSNQPSIKQILSGGRSLTALEAASAAGLQRLDPAALAAVADERLRYSAPDAPPPAPKPDYKYMQGDKKKRRKKR
ncbi:MAG TPA: hypothetical protein VFA79_06390 [Myxococcales bacterium]|nr:hypothetical protein [Myxococcales bacterium]